MLLSLSLTGLHSAAPENATPRTAPNPPPLPRGPVLIHDAITPCGGTTLLALILKAGSEDQDQP